MMVTSEGESTDFNFMQFEWIDLMKKFNLNFCELFRILVKTVNYSDFWGIYSIKIFYELLRILSTNCE